MESLLEWVKENCENEKHKELWESKGKVGMRVDPKSDCGDRILVALEPLPKSLRLPLPPACILTDDKVKASPIGKALTGLDIYTLFAMFLVFHKRLGEKSFWRFYVDVLPKDISFHPITDYKRFMSRVEQNTALREALEKEPLLQRALQAQDEKLQREFELASKLIEMHSKKEDELGSAFEAQGPVTYEEFLWGSCMVVSRAFDMSEPKLICMLPFVDSMNHSSRHPTVLWRPKLPHGFFITTLLRDLDAGQELCANYHGTSISAKTKLDDVKQYVMYGFVETDAFGSVRAAATTTP